MTDTQFGEMVSQYEKLVYTVCYQLCRDHHTAQDLTQETFLSAYAHQESCPAEGLRPWLARIAANKAKDHLKSAYNRRVYSADKESLPSSGQVLFIQDTQPEDIALSRESVQHISAAIHALQEPYLHVSVMFFIEEKSVDEISRLLGRPSKTVHTQLYRARRLLQQQLAAPPPPHTNQAEGSDTG